MPDATATTDQQQAAAAAEGAAATTTTTTTDSAAVELTDEQVQAFLSKKGINVTDFDVLKQKAEYEIPAPAPTDEEKKKADAAEEKRLLDKHLALGGTIEQFTAYKQVLAANPVDLGYSKIHDELQKEGYSAEQSASIIRKMHLQVNEEDLADLDDAQKEALKKEAAYGLKKQTNRGTVIQNKAKSYLDTLRDEVKAEDAEKAKMAAHSSKVEEAIKKYQRKETLEIGLVDEQAHAPIDFEVSDAALAATEAILKDPQALEKLLYTEQGDLNLEFLIPHLVKSHSMSEAVKKGYLTGGTRQVEHFQATFGATIPSLGGPAKSKAGDGKIVKVGKPTLANPVLNN